MASWLAVSTPLSIALAFPFAEHSNTLDLHTLDLHTLDTHTLDLHTLDLHTLDLQYFTLWVFIFWIIILVIRYALDVPPTPSLHYNIPSPQIHLYNQQLATVTAPSHTFVLTD